MKNFFKKLSFVMALAMIISVIAPAAGAFAASAPALSAKGTKYLYLGNATKSSLDLNVTNKPAGAKYAWTSSSKTIATVDKYGVVVGKKQGNAKISLTITKKDGSTTVLSVDFVVRNNIKSFTGIVDAAGADIAKLEVGKAYDLNSKFTTNGGSTTSTSSKARWSVDSDKATIDVKTGLFTATAAGTYKVTVNAFETETGADAWVALNDKTSTAGVKATGTFEVTVLNKMTEAKQATLSTVKVSFAGVTEDAASKLAVYQLVGTTKVKQLVKSITLDDAKKVATVALWTDFSQEATYVIDYPDMESVQFVAAKVAQDQVTDFTVSKHEVEYNVAWDIAKDIKLFNKDGVDITTNTLKSYITYETASTKGWLSNDGKLTIFNLKDSATVKVTFHSYKWDSTTGTEIGNIVKEIAYVAVDKVSATMTGVNAWTLAKLTDSPSYTKDLKQSLTVKENDLYLRAEINQINADGKVYTKDNTKFAYTSSDESVLIIDPVSGRLYPVKAGTAVVVISYGETANKTSVGAVQITVNPEKKAQNLTFDVSGFTLSTGAADNSKTVKVKSVDQYNNATDATVTSVDGVSPNAIAIENDADHVLFTGNNEVKFTAFIDKSPATNKVLANGDYTFKITADGVSRVITFTVGTPNGAVTTERIKLNASTFDLKYTQPSDLKKVDISIVGYASNGLAVSETAIGGYTSSTDQTVLATLKDQYRVVVDAPENQADLITDSIDLSKFAITTTAPETAYKVEKLPVGTYVVTVYKVIQTAGASTGATTDDVYAEITVDRTTFTVTDTQAKPVLEKINTLYFTTGVTGTVDGTNATVLAALKECFKISLGGNELKIVDAKVLGTTSSINVESIVVREYLDSNVHYIDHTVNIGLTIKK